MRFVPKSPRMRWLAAVLVLVFAGAGGAALFAYSLSQPHPERYAAGVLSGGTVRQEVLANPVARTYLRDFRTQESFSSCGPASVVNVLASLGAPVAGERALFAGKPWERLSMRVQGMTLDDLAALVAARDLGQTTILRDLSYETFLEHLQRANRLDNRYIVNFDRGPVFGVSVGHFSPIGGYDAVGDRVVLLDVTPGYGPSLIPSRLLYTAVQTIDSATGRSRGLLRISDISALAGPVGPGPDGPVPGSPHTTPRRSP